MWQKCADFSVQKYTQFYQCPEFTVHKAILNHVNVLFQVAKQCMHRIWPNTLHDLFQLYFIVRILDIHMRLPWMIYKLEHEITWESKKEEIGCMCTIKRSDKFRRPYSKTNCWMGCFQSKGHFTLYLCLHLNKSGYLKGCILYYWGCEPVFIKLVYVTCHYFDFILLN